MSILKELKQLFHMTLLLMFHQHWRTISIFLCLALGFVGWASLLTFIVASFCAQVMYLKKIDKATLYRMCKWTMYILVPVSIVTAGIISAALYWGPVGEPPSKIAVDTMNSIHTTLLGVAMCVLFGAVIVGTYSQYDNLDKGFNLLFLALFRKPESRIPLLLICCVEVAAIILGLGIYLALPLMVSWVLMYVYDMRVLRKSKQKSKSTSTKFVPLLQN